MLEGNYLEWSDPYHMKLLRSVERATKHITDRRTIESIIDDLENDI